MMFDELEQGVQAALETYSNVHRGSGHFSMATTHLYDMARDIVLNYLGLEKGRYVVVFGTPRLESIFKARLKAGDYQCLSSEEIGLPLGVRALAVKRKALPGGMPFQVGGGNARLIAPGWVVWAKAPAKFEAGTPAIINVIAFAKALQMFKRTGKDFSQCVVGNNISAKDILYQDELEAFSGKVMLQELRKTLIGRGTLVPTLSGVRTYINLDNAASTPTFFPVWETVKKTWQQSKLNRQEIIEEVRSVVSATLNAPATDYDVLFTSNTTEAINLAAESLALDQDKDHETVILSTLLEHSSNDLPWRKISRLPLIRLAIDKEGFVDLRQMEKVLSGYNQEGEFANKRIRLVAVSGASNVLGIYNNIEEIGRIAHKYGAQVLVDAAQMVAHRQVNMAVAGVDYLAFSAHKVYAPFGCGVLLAKKGLLNFHPDELEFIRSSGEENTGGIAALGKALLLLKRIGMDLVQEEEELLTKKTLLGLKKIPGLRLHGIESPESPGFGKKGGVIAFEMKGKMADKIAKQLAEKGGIGIRFGCHCAHILVKHLVGLPHLLERIQGCIIRLFPGIQLPGVARVSFGIENDETDVDALLHTLSGIAVKPSSAKDGQQGDLHRETQELPKEELIRQMNDFVADVTRKVYSPA